MELFQEILIKALEKEEINISFANLKISTTEIVETECYKTLQKIKNIIENDTFSDFECVEKIVCIFENIGSNAGSRHDFS